MGQYACEQYRNLSEKKEKKKEEKNSYMVRNEVKFFLKG